ncbi:hypothetical protein LTR85_004503 [Meristemomyces frigidus]|nr:hypothetical protein LTR85_004503 [Meristemomyces frigidus]
MVHLLAGSLFGLAAFSQLADAFPQRLDKRQSTASASPSSTASTTSSASSSTCTAGGVSDPNGPYVDSNGVNYVIHCSQDNSQGSYGNTYPPSLRPTFVGVNSGGFAQCFAACDASSGCIGFTYSGGDSGNCYLKTAEGTYSSAGSNIVSAFRLCKRSKFRRKLFSRPGLFVQLCD